MLYIEKGSGTSFYYRYLDQDGSENTIMSGGGSPPDYFACGDWDGDGSDDYVHVWLQDSTTSNIFIEEADGGSEFYTQGYTYHIDFGDWVEECEPELSYSPTSISFGTHCQGWTGSDTFEIWNSGNCELTYSISENIDWIVSINPSSGSSTGEHDTITVNVGNTDDMSGYYSGSILISSNAGSGNILVDITISEPELCYSPTSIHFGTHCEGWTGSDTFEIWNCNGCGTLTYTISESISWITSINPSSGSSTGEHDTITVNVGNTDDMSGYYSGYISISSSAGSGSIFVDITINEIELSYSPDTINFGTQYQGWTGSDTFNIWNSGCGTLTYSISESIPWIQVEPMSGSSTGEYDEITVSVINTGSMDGYYSGYIDISSNGGSGSVFVDITIIPQPAAEWTVMVYLDADNNLESYGIDDFLEMAEAGSTDDVNIIVQFDRVDGYSDEYGDWTSTKRYRITQDMVPNSANALLDIGEANMGDKQTLIDFCDWAIEDYPANQYCLILWDHGSGWKYNSWITKSVCLDETSGDSLEMDELRSALNSITNNGNNPINLIGFDACLMQMIEVGYEIRSYGEYMTGSEETEPGMGWKYDDTLTVLVGSPTMSPLSLGAQFVSDYVNAGGVTLSTVNLGLFNDLRADVSDLGAILKNNEYKDEIQSAINNVENYDDSDYVDLYHFAKLIKDYIDNSEVDTKADAVMNEVENVVTSENHDSSHTNSHGLSIYVPEDEYKQSYGDLLFAEDSQWDELLEWYHKGPNSPPDKPTNPSPFDGETDVSINPILSVDVSDPDDDLMNVSFYDASDNSLIGSDTNVPSGSSASVNWWGLNPLTTYTWYAVAYDNEYTNQSDNWNFTTGEDNQPPSAPVIEGQKTGFPFVAYSFKFTSIDPDGDEVSYYIEWGDGKITDWTAFRPSGDSYDESHSWERLGSFKIKAQAEDTNGLKSNWTEFTIRMPRSRYITSPLFNFIYNFLQSHPNMFPIIRQLLNL